jgi:hypothetical protein
MDETSIKVILFRSLCRFRTSHLNREFKIHGRMFTIRIFDVHRGNLFPKKHYGTSIGVSPLIFSFQIEFNTRYTNCESSVAQHFGQT